MNLQKRRNAEGRVMVAEAPLSINGGAIIDHEAPRERGFVAVEK